MKQINQEHLDFLEECKQIFQNEPFRETHISEDRNLIGLRYGLDRDCIKIFELGEGVGFFVQMMSVCVLEKRVKVGDNCDSK